MCSQPGHSFTEVYGIEWQGWWWIFTFVVIEALIKGRGRAGMSVAIN